ncbi:hypothetical protein O4G76_15390 [Limimaricola sp. G21655-S1]|uniref:hypothetical protein n=1 Tax=Limimaricola sp. G21655-S1 TaxID=3014768 RepID=UPI0022AF2E95|nr:hypothetical protein [Limimaricola sp. G21655-S1]MCZ4262225.1 hypothetical protein [Limimaricola sp. G21655-S1]
MNYDTKNMRAALRAANLRQDFTDWLRTDADRLISAAVLLGGELWEERAAAVVDAIAFGAEPEEVVQDLDDLHRLLTLEYTDDIDSPEALCFQSVHPDDPRADDARLCAEALERGLEAIRKYAATTVKEVA